MASYYCRSCGASVARNASFCAECGVRSPAAANPLSAPDSQPQARSRTASPARRRGNQGLVLGVLGCCLGLLAVFSFGLVFVPLAVLISLLGLLMGLAGRSAAGTIAGIGGLTLSAIGFFSSPTLMLVTGGLLVASKTGDGSPTTASQTSATEQTTQSLPQQQQNFCDITSAASTKYFSLSRDMKMARDEKNGILEKRAEEAMTATAQGRNAEIFKLVRQTNFKFENWAVQLLKVGTPNSKRVTFSVRPLCSDIVTIHLTTSPNVALIEALAKKRVGDAFLVSGAFVGSRADTDDPPAAPEVGRLERSMTEQGSMKEPEYWALLN